MAHQGSTHKREEYVLGYSNNMTSIFARRSASKCAGFVLPHLRPDMRILDVGCGPGSITCELAAFVPQGSVTGVDVSDIMLGKAREEAARKGVQNVEIMRGDVLAGLEFEDGAFDVVYSHQVLVHLSDPVKALREMKRVCKPGGLVASRNGISHLWYPTNPALESLDHVYSKVLSHGAAHEPAGGTKVHAYARQAGFDPAKVDTGVTGHSTATPGQRQATTVFYQNLLEEDEGFKTKARQIGITDARMKEISDAVKAWADDEDGWQTMVCGETLCWV